MVRASSLHLVGRHVGLEHHRGAVRVERAGVHLQQLALGTLADVLLLRQVGQLSGDVTRAEQLGNVLGQVEPAPDQVLLVGPDHPALLVPELHVPDAAVLHPVPHHRVELRAGSRPVPADVAVDQRGGQPARDSCALRPGLVDRLVPGDLPRDDDRADRQQDERDQARRGEPHHRRAHHGAGHAPGPGRAVRSGGAHRRVRACPRSTTASSCAVGVQLHQQGLHVAAARVHRDPELARDRPGVTSLGEQLQDVLLPWRERGARQRLVDGSLRCPGHHGVQQRRVDDESAGARSSADRAAAPAASRPSAAGHTHPP